MSQTRMLDVPTNYLRNLLITWFTLSLGTRNLPCANRRPRQSPPLRPTQYLRRQPLSATAPSVP